MSAVHRAHVRITDEALEGCTILTERAVAGDGILTFAFSSAEADGPRRIAEAMTRLADRLYYEAERVQ